MSADKINVVIDGRKYEWYGYLGCILLSRERGVKQGDIRLIENEIMYAYRVYSNFPFKLEIHWCSIHNPSIEKINDFKNKLFGVQQ